MLGVFSLFLGAGGRSLVSGDRGDANNSDDEADFDFKVSIFAALSIFPSFFVALSHSIKNSRRFYGAIAVFCFSHLVAFASFVLSVLSLSGGTAGTETLEEEQAAMRKSPPLLNQVH